MKNIFDVIIVGAGLAGITAALEIFKRNSNLKIAIIERNKIGGQCISIKSNNNFFDIGGHFFHNLDKIPIEYQDFSKQCLPFKKNTYTIDIENKLYHGMIQNFFNIEKNKKQNFSTLEKYFITTFSKELYNIFLGPYNQKINVSKLKDCQPIQITKDRTPMKGNKSYNSYFVYPKKGGCEAFIKFLWAKIKNNIYFFNDEVIKFDLQKKSVKLKSGDIIKFTKALFNSSSIVDFLGLNKFSPTVYVYNGFGKTRKDFNYLTTDPNWTYIANPKTSVFRLGNYQICGAKKKYNRIPFYLESCKPLEKDDLLFFFENYEIKSSFIVKNAYPVLTKGYQKKIEKQILQSEKNNLFWIGRYGKDKWFSMSETILDTIKTVEKLKWI